ncbi:MAG: hypothetical protein NHB14_05175 [Desulfosporosinus sp.]|nr:hypothetical protein [Desulfosporosinus sp.]
MQGGDSIKEKRIIKMFSLMVILVNIFYITVAFNTVRDIQITKGTLANIFYLPVAIADEEESDSEDFSQEREDSEVENESGEGESENEFFTELGGVAVVLGFATVSIYFIRIFNKVFLGNKNSFLTKTRKYLKSAHPYLGVLLIVSSGIHGYSLLGEDEALLGLAAWIALVIIILSAFAKKFKIKKWLNIHKVISVLFVMLLFSHLLTL